MIVRRDATRYGRLQCRLGLGSLFQFQDKTRRSRPRGEQIFGVFSLEKWAASDQHAMQSFAIVSRGHHRFLIGYSVIQNAEVVR